MTTELAPIDTGQTMMSLIQRAATDEAFSVEKLEHLLAVKERWEKEEARKAYVAALADFKTTPPQIVKDKSVDFTNKAGYRTHYRHASLGQVADAVAGGLARHSLSHSWAVAQGQGGITVTCTLTHAFGHSEAVSITGPQDDSGQKNGIQQVGSAITYLERYTLMAITGLAAADTDDDGQAAGHRPPEPRGANQQRPPRRRQPAEQPKATIVPDGPPPEDAVLDAEVGPSASAPARTEWEEIHDAILGNGFQVEQVLPPGIATINDFAKMGGLPGDLRTRLENLTAEQGTMEGIPA